VRRRRGCFIAGGIVTLDVVGVAAMAPPTDLAELMQDDQGTASGILLTAIAVESWARFYPRTPAAEVVRPRFLPAVVDLDSECRPPTRTSSRLLTSRCYGGGP
jgi:hypothetical protein